MKITEIKIKKTFDEGPLKAIVSIALDDELVVHDIKLIMTDKNKEFISMPYVKLGNGKYLDISHPISKEFRDYLETKVIEAYYNKLLQ